MIDVLVLVRDYYQIYNHEKFDDVQVHQIVEVILQDDKKALEQFYSFLIS